MVWGCRERPSYNYAAGGGFFDSQADTQIKHSLASDKNAYPEFPDTSTARRSVYSQSLHVIISSFKNILVSITALNLKCCQKKKSLCLLFFCVGSKWKAQRGTADGQQQSTTGIQFQIGPWKIKYLWLSIRPALLRQGFQNSFSWEADQ